MINQNYEKLMKMNLVRMAELYKLQRMNPSIMEMGVNSKINLKKKWNVKFIKSGILS